MTEKAQLADDMSEFKINNVLSEVSNDIHGSLQDGQKRFAKLEEECKKHFSDDETSIIGATIAWALLDTPLALFFVGQNSAVFVELHSLLERYVLRDLSPVLAKDKEAAEIISLLIERRTLGELADVIRRLQIWDADDVRFAKKLVNIRNGIVHKNTKVISRFFYDGRDVHVLNIEGVVNQVDAIPYILETIGLLLKLSAAAR